MFIRTISLLYVQGKKNIPLELHRCCGEDMRVSYVSSKMTRPTSEVEEKQ